MFYNSNEFKALQAGMNLTWAQQQLHMHNIANIETPKYKAQSLVFDEVLKTETENSSGGISSMSAKVVTDETASVLPNGNNVSVEIESMELYKSYVQYSALLDKLKGQFTNYGHVLNSSIK